MGGGLLRLPGGGALALAGMRQPALAQRTMLSALELIPAAPAHETATLTIDDRNGILLVQAGQDGWVFSVGPGRSITTLILAMAWANNEIIPPE
jgi:hypothetical protein